MASGLELYEQWRAVSRDHAEEWALADAATGRRWTFRELDRETGRESSQALGNLCHPEGMGPEFLISLLRAWRCGQVTCPVEFGGARPGFTQLPAGCVHLKLTSATTGAPRAVAFSASQLKADVDHIMTAMGLNPAWPNVAAISLAHSYGFSSLVLPLLLRGMPLILAGGALPEQVRKAAALAETVVLPAVPALWRAWHEAGTLPGNVRVAISAGAPLPVGLEQEVFQRAGLKVHNFYGSSECGGIAYDAGDAPRTDGQFAGEVMGGVALEVNEEGCMEVRGANVGLTYWPDASEELADGIFRTRDLAQLRDGNVWLTGRAGDRINVAGRKISPEAVERVLGAHPAVRECVVFGVPEASAGRGETVVAAVVLREPAQLEEVRRHAQANLPGWEIPREWWRLDELPVNERGKIPRAEMGRRYLEQGREATSKSFGSDVHRLIKK
jgi:long-chain acyl-CoA synthetase